MNILFKYKSDSKVFNNTCLQFKYGHNKTNEEIYLKYLKITTDL